MELPSGTITFLFTDIEGSTRLWEEQPDAMGPALARHDDIVRAAIEGSGGIVFKTFGDAFCAAFSSAPLAIEAALAAQQNLISAADDNLTLRVRMALHSGEAERRAGDYFGKALNRVARLLSTAHGGQVLLSNDTQELTREQLPDECSLRSIGVHRLRDLSRPEIVFQLCHPELPADFHALRSLDNPELPNNLPIQMTTFVGRQTEMADVQSLLANARLLTLTGSGGTGKTRLMLQAAAEFDQVEVWLVELAPLTQPDMVVQEVASTIGIREEAGRPLLQTLVDALKRRKMLLLLDNCEHVLLSAAKLTDALLKSCNDVKILATSREALGVAGEQTYRVPSLGIPPNNDHDPLQYESVRLFADRALLVRADFTVSEANGLAIVRICRRLDGIPLALELAAARVRAMPVEQLEARLDDCFRVLTGGSRTALPRQQTLRALIDWSYDLLSPQEQTVFRRLAAFSGGWYLEAAEQACAGDGVEEWEVLDLLVSLVDKSLVIYEEQDGRERYRMLETVRQYSRDRLMESGEGPAVRRAHLRYFSQLVIDSDDRIRGPEQLACLAQIETEHDNLRAALEFCLGEPDEAAAGLELAASIWRFWYMRSYISEGRDRLAQQLAHTSSLEPTTARAAALGGSGILAKAQSDYTAARSRMNESLAIRTALGDRPGIAMSLGHLGLVASEQSDYATARRLYGEGLAVHRELGNRRAIAAGLNNLGVVCLNLGEHDEGVALFEEALAINRQIGDLHAAAASLGNLGLIAAGRADYDRARPLYEKALELNRELGDRNGIATALNNLGNVENDLGHHERARPLLEESIALRRALGDQRGTAGTLSNLGLVWLAARDYAAARACCEQSLAIRRDVGDRSGAANALANLASVLIREGQRSDAKAPLDECLALCLELGTKNIAVHALHSCAAIAVNRQELERAVTFYGASKALLKITTSALAPVHRVAIDGELARLEQLLGSQSYTASFTAGEALSFPEAIAQAKTWLKSDPA